MSLSLLALFDEAVYLPDTNYHAEVMGTKKNGNASCIVEYSS